jgi:hypothetical protein
MAIIKDNLATEGLSGKVGNIVFRRRKADGKVIVSKHSVVEEREPTDAQQKIHDKFQRASVYGKAAIANATTKAAYAAKAEAGKSAYNIAIADFFHAPVIESIDVSAYKGVVGNVIRIRAWDDFKVTGVHVVIANSDGTLVEEGDAVKQSNELDWLFTAKKANATLTGDKITVTATDLPMNKTVLIKTIGDK